MSTAIVPAVTPVKLPPRALTPPPNWNFGDQKAVEFRSQFTKNADKAFDDFCKKYLNSTNGFFSIGNQFTQSPLPPPPPPTPPPRPQKPQTKLAIQNGPTNNTTSKHAASSNTPTSVKSLSSPNKPPISTNKLLVPTSKSSSSSSKNRSHANNAEIPPRRAPTPTPPPKPHIVPSTKPFTLGPRGSKHEVVQFKSLYSFDSAGFMSVSSLPAVITSPMKKPPTPTPSPLIVNKIITGNKTPRKEIELKANLVNSQQIDANLEKTPPRADTKHQSVILDTRHIKSNIEFIKRFYFCFYNRKIQTKILYL